MTSPKNILRNFPFGSLLLPVFFILHGWKENYYYIHSRDIAVLLLTFLAASAILFFLSLLFFRNKIKAGLYTVILLSIYFFFGAVQDFLKEHSATGGIARYKFLLPLILLVITGGFIVLKKTKKDLHRLNFFLNILLFVFILLDLAIIITLPAKKRETITVANFPANNGSCTNCQRPDIYFLLFDEYASSTALKQYWNYDNSNFDSSLTTRGFTIITESQSNYNFTPFSMASILNMSYLDGIKDVNACSLEDYSMCNDLILNNGVTSYLRNNGYDFINYSIFDIKGAPSHVYQSFLPLKTRLITEQTLFNRLKKDLGYLVLTGTFKIKWLANKFFYSGLRNNNYFLDKIKNDRGKKDSPRFVYAHFYMPHPPFYFDSTGKERDPKKIVEEEKNIPVDPYLQYVGYTNKQILSLVDTILKRSSTPPVIIIMGDHGFRNCKGKEQDCNFKNMNAIYLPGKNYSHFYDSLSGVNEFRAVFNTIFKENFPMLKDSTIFLTDKK